MNTKNKNNLNSMEQNENKLHSEPRGSTELDPQKKNQIKTLEVKINILNKDINDCNSLISDLNQQGLTIRRKMKDKTIHPELKNQYISELKEITNKTSKLEQYIMEMQENIQSKQKELTTLKKGTKTRATTSIQPTEEVQTKTTKQTTEVNHVPTVPKEHEPTEVTGVPKEQTEEVQEIQKPIRQKKTSTKTTPNGYSGNSFERTSTRYTPFNFTKSKE